MHLKWSVCVIQTWGIILNGLLSELRRRNIFRISGVYAITGWILAQISGVLESSLNLPQWFDTIVVSLLLIGFPVALVLAWAFEMTPEGMKRTEGVSGENSIAAKTGRKLDFAILGGLVLVGVLIVGSQFTAQNGAGPPITQQAQIDGSTSIAVLPFVDLSPDGDQEFFADGISEEILNVLVPIDGLKVAGRTSSFSFKGRNEDLREIGKALNVNHVLEGSVRRSGTKLRITAQLIRSDDGFHLWSQTYDRELTDIFAIQDEIARSVAEQLAPSLGLSFGLSSETLVKDRTEDIVAYELYLRAKQLFEKRGLDNLDTALLLLSEASARDPDFAPIWIELANVYRVYLSYQTDIPTKTTIEHWWAIGEAAARRAIKLSPDSGEAYAGLGSFYAADFNWIKAFEEFDRAIALAPDNANIIDNMAQNLMEVGQYEKAIEMSLRAVEIDPLVAIYRFNLAEAYEFNGDIEKAITQYQRGRILSPSLSVILGGLWGLYISEGRTQDALNLAETAFVNGMMSQEDLDATRAIHRAVETGSDEAVRALIKNHAFIKSVNNSNPRYLLARKIGDKQMAIDAMDWYWSNVVEQGLFYSALRHRKIDFVYDQPRFKQQMRKNNILAYWQHAGFPPYCKPVGADDFECERSVSKTVSDYE